jgi:hypothetical protein
MSRRLSGVWGFLMGAMALSLLAAPQARAAMPGLYFSGFYMDSTLAYSTADVDAATMEDWRADIWENDFGAIVGDVEEYDFDRKDIGYSFALGYQMSEYFAAEFSYVQIGETRYSAIGNVQLSEDGSVYRSLSELRTRARGFGLTGIAIWPMGDHFSLDARAGVLLGKKKVSYQVVVQGVGYGDGSMKDDSIAYMLGAGINWSMSPGTAIRLGYVRMQNALYQDRSANSWLFGLKYAW